MSHSQKLAQFVTALDFESLPPEVVESAKRHLLDTVGVGLNGALQEMPRLAFAGIQATSGSVGPVPVWGTDLTLAAPYAAMANGISCHVLDFDDTHTAGIVHGSAIIAPVVFALSEDLNLSGRDVITAFVAGWEVAARVGLAAKGSFHRRGYHTSSIAGVFGAAVAAGKLIGLTEEQMVNAIALAGSQASGINEYQSNGSSSKILHTGWAAFAGIVAANLARAGMTGPATVFEGRLGLLNAYGERAEADVDQLSDGLGARWEVTRIAIKPYSCCHFGHAFIDCARELRTKGVTPEQVAAIECVVPELEVPMICEPAELKRNPTSPYAAKFSLPFMVAAALADGCVGHQTFTPSNIKRTDLLDLAARVSYRVAAPDETTFPIYFPGWLRVETTSGRRLEERMDVNWGTPENPMSQADLETKFRDNARDVTSSGQAERLIRSIAALDRANAADIGRLTTVASI